jgi:hypothetical protein
MEQGLMPDTTANETLTRRELEAKIAKRAWQDEAFRAEFLADPAAAFVKYAGVPAAQLPRIAVHEEQPGSWHIVLPAKPVDASEMTDEELEKVAGGFTPSFVLLGGAIVAAPALATAMAFNDFDDNW